MPPEKPCHLHEETPKYKMDKKKEGPGGGGALRCEECAPWQRYILYALPVLLYLPWAIGKLRCPPKCCPPVSCCPPPPQPCPQPRQRTCAEHNPAKGRIQPAPRQKCNPPPPKQKLRSPKDKRYLIRQANPCIDNAKGRIQPPLVLSLLDIGGDEERRLHAQPQLEISGHEETSSALSQATSAL